MSICVIFNPTARGDKAKAFRERLAALGSNVTLKPTYAPGSARTLAAEAVRSGFATIVAAGGDGTVNEVLNGIADEPTGVDRARLGVLPLGTINVFARELRLPKNLAEAWQVIERGEERKIDLPQAVFSATGEGRCFAQLGGVGLDSRSIELVNWEHKKRFGSLAYFIAGLEAVMETQPRLVVETAEKRCEGELVLIGNGGRYGGEFDIFPGASLDDGRLHAAVFPKVNVPALLRFGWGWLTDRIHAATGCQLIQADSIRVSAERSLAVELDGDNVGRLPVTFGLRRSALRVLAPRG